ncbi:hypothetical protein jaqu_13160 [Jannaschia aquimarina]|uniref:Uncharacterized protein n=2 Tax=Jannaschia aquimarina TaxID=935700 RepID=A0A0D1EIV8_9RHOB|nr:hypothetical protein [Jannaschia aquimarina]KIT16821.1 hypothetical protein jaqu_13160 [Jannaschia aquimarina]SNT13568.1 hypothetical protein SAMN05421775_106131 [Jannaschia aquimarina]
MGKPTKGREDRLKAALKANMARRKAQTKARGSTPNHEGRAKTREQEKPNG